MDPVFTQQIQMPKPQSKGGMFGGGGGWADFASALLGGLSAGMGSPLGAMSLQRLHQQRMMKQQQAMEEQQYSRQRQDKRDDFVFEQDYRRDNPLPAQPSDYVQALAAQGIVPGTPEFAKHMATFTGIKENPIVMTPYGPMPYSSVVTPQASRPVGKLTPIEEGGPTPRASGGFPPSGY